MTLALLEFAPPQTGLALLPDAALVLIDKKARTDLFGRIKASMEGFTPDVSTPTGRKLIASKAHQVAKSKAAIEAARLQLTSEWREKTKTVNAEGKTLDEQLTLLAAQIRRPLTDWEAEDKVRDDNCTAVMTRLQQARVIESDETSGDVAARLAEIRAVEINDDAFQDRAPAARHALGAAIDALTAGFKRLAQAEADAAELAALREAAAERARQDEIVAAAAVAEAERVAAEAAEVERQRVEAARLAQMEIDRAAAITAAAEQARLDAEATAQRVIEEAAAKVERDRLAAIAATEAETARVAAIHAAEVAEIQRQADARQAAADATEKARIETLRANEAEQRRRNEDVAHKSAVMAAAKAAIMEHGKVDEPTAKLIVLAIKAAEIPNVHLSF